MGKEVNFRVWLQTEMLQRSPIQKGKRLQATATG